MTANNANANKSEEARALVERAREIKHLPGDLYDHYKMLEKLVPDLAAALEVALARIEDVEWEAYKKGLQRGALIGARELCIYCANNHKAVSDNEFIPSYVHTFKESGKVYVCAASSIWNGIDYWRKSQDKGEEDE